MTLEELKTAMTEMVLEDVAADEPRTLALIDDMMDCLIEAFMAPQVSGPMAIVQKMVLTEVLPGEFHDRCLKKLETL